MFSDRSWASSRMIVSYWFRNRSLLGLGQQDAVGHQLDVASPAAVASAKRILKPTCWPSGEPSSSASRAAIDRAAIRRGWVWPIMPSTPRPNSRQIFGSWVDLPEPVSPQTIVTACDSTARRISSTRAVIGSWGS